MSLEHTTQWSMFMTHSGGGEVGVGGVRGGWCEGWGMGGVWGVWVV
jgi:hypothetical protein